MALYMCIMFDCSGQFSGGIPSRVFAKLYMGFPCFISLCMWCASNFPYSITFLSLLPQAELEHNNSADAC